MTRLSRPTLTVFFLLITACAGDDPPARQEVARPAKIFTVKAPGTEYMRSFPGEVQATDEAELAFRVSGELVEMLATRGSQVKQGDLLARLDAADFQAAADQAQAEYDLAKSQFQRTAELVKRKLVSQAEHDQKNAVMRVRQSGLTRAENNLDYTRLIAPFDGIVARRLAENFESVAAGQVVLILQTGDMVDVTVDVPESIIARVQRTATQRNPRPVNVSFDSASDQVFPALYKEHETQADPATLTYRVTVSMAVPDGINILPGMTATVTADLSELFEGESDGYLAPIEAVFAAEDAALDSDTRYVWKVDPATMRTSRAGVSVGALTGDSIVVLGGIREGDMIIAAGVNSVQDGMLVRSMTREAGL